MRGTGKCHSLRRTRPTRPVPSEPPPRRGGALTCSGVGVKLVERLEAEAVAA